MTIEEILARLKWLEEIAKILQRKPPRKETRH
jgi:hypothetical protein